MRTDLCKKSIIIRRAENINGLIRQYIFKGSSFENLIPKDIQRIENRLNHRPKKTLGWRTSYEVFYEYLKAS